MVEPATLFLCAGGAAGMEFEVIRLLHVEDDLDILEIASLSIEMAGGFELFQS